MIHRRRRWRARNWPTPLVYAVIAIVAGLTSPRFEARFLPEFYSGMSAQSAVSIYSSVGTGMLALTGIVFSLAFVMVQFSASAYSPRLVLWLANDPVVSHALGVFIATFLYAIAALAWVDRSGSGKVPRFSLTLVFSLLLASVVMFIWLLQRISLLQVNRMLSFTGDLGRRVIEEMYPPLETPVAWAAPEEYRSLPVTQTVIYRGRPQSLQAVNFPMLLGLAAASGGILELTVSVGDTLVEGLPLIHVYSGAKPIRDSSVRRALEMGNQRTFEQDPKYALRLLVDIAIKALSAAINDPTTAVQALDQIGDLLLRLGRRRLEIGSVRDPQGTLRLVVHNPAWEDFAALAFDEIRYCGAGSIQVMRRMKALVSDLVAALPIERHAVLLHYRERLDSTIARSFADAEERRHASVEDRQGLGVPGRGPDPGAS